MSEERPEFVPILIRQAEIQQPPLIATPVPAQLQTTPSEEDARVAAAVFAQQEAESRAVANLLGMWTGSMVLHDLLKDTFTRPAGEFEEEETRRQEDKKTEKLP
jgi:hypothetical protein